MDTTINGTTIVGGREMRVTDTKVFIDGKDVTPDAKEINIAITGNVERLDVDVCSKITVTGDVGDIKTVTGKVEIGGSVSGSVHTITGDVECGGAIDNATVVAGTISSHKRH